MTTGARRLPILTFHALDHEPAICAFSPDVFRRGLASLREHGYRTLALDDVGARARAGTPFPPRSLVITFDDGYRSVYAKALPVLQEHGMTATVFLTVGAAASAAAGDRLPSLEGREMLGWSEIREMARAGIAFGAHSLTHADLTRLPPERVEAEILGSKTLIEERLGTAVSSFAYPYGRYDRQSRALVCEHFALGCSDALGLVGAGSDPWTLPRVDTYYLRSERLFGLLTSAWFPSYVRARSVPRRIRRWVQSAGRR